MLHIYPLCYALVARLPPERQRQQAGQKRRTKPERGQSGSAGSAGRQSGRSGGHQQPKVCPVRPVRPVCHAHCLCGAQAVTHLLTVDLFEITNLEIYERTDQRQGFQGFCRKEEIRTSNTWSRITAQLDNCINYTWSKSVIYWFFAFDSNFHCAPLNSH